MDIMNYMDFDDFSKQPFPQMIRQVQNIQSMIVYDYSRYFIIEPNFKTTKISTKLIIDKLNGKTIEKEFNEKIDLSEEMLRSRRVFSAFLGIIKVLNYYFLLMVDDVLQICVMENHDFFQIISISFVSFENEKELKKDPQKWKEMVRIFEIIKKLFASGFYFSYSYDLSISKQKRAEGCTLPNESFWWNQFLLKDLISQKVDSKWRLVLIQGFIKGFSVYIMGKKLEFYLISRKSCKQAGTRYNARGIDDDGNVANFVETEQIIYYSYYCFSFLQIRGSVPLFWEQKSLTSSIKLSRGLDLTIPAYTKHFTALQKDYSRILCINLLSKKKNEQILTDGFESLIQKQNLDYVKYDFFDFHAACKGGKYENLEVLLERIGELIENFKFFAEQIKKEQKYLLFQAGIVRINCVDCLDRTNVLMTKIGAYMFEAIMKHLNINLNLALGDSLMKLIDLSTTSAKKVHPFVYNFKNIWADNGDYLSVFYSGTGSTISNITRHGNTGFLNMLDHGMKSIERFYINNFEDQFKQEGIEILLGQDNGEFYLNQFEKLYSKELEMKENEYICSSPLNIYILSWNISGFKPSTMLDLIDLDMFNFENNNIPDIIAIGLQEVVNLNIKSVMSNNDKLNLSWENIILNNANKLNEKFVVISQKDLIGCFLIVLAKDSIKERIKKIEYDVVALGLAGKLGNKGAVLIKLHMDDTSFCFINCHLQAGSKKIRERAENINQVHMKAFRKIDEKIENYDYKFLFGDLNFRVSKPNNEVREKMKLYQNYIENKNEKEAEKILQELQASDETFLTRKYSEFFDKYQEAPLIFAPTYKYDIFSTLYDSSKKQRCPSWCDRIMIWTNEDCIVKQFFYNRKEAKLSDHRPVVAYYSVEVKKVNVEKREKIINFISNYIAEEKLNEEEAKN